MRALRGDLFEIADEDPLALFPDVADDTNRTVAPDPATTADQASAPSEPQAARGNHIGASVRRVAAFAAVVCAAAGLVIVVGSPDSTQTKRVPQRAASRPPEPDLKVGVSDSGGKSKDASSATSQRRAPTPASATPVSTPGAPSAPPVPPVPPAATPVESVSGPDTAEREFGFER
jgi:hypothetical protein